MGFSQKNCKLWEIYEMHARIKGKEGYRTREGGEGGVNLHFTPALSQ